MMKNSTRHLPQNRWRLLYYLNIHRILLSGFFISLFYFNITLDPFGQLKPEIFKWVSIFYFGFSLFSNFSINNHWPSFYLQANLQIIVDVFALLLLIHASGGVLSGVGLLLIIPIASSSILMSGVLAYFYAALASLLLLFDQFYLFLYSYSPPAYSQAGILGIILFGAGLLTNYLAIKLKRTQALALQMEDDLENMRGLARFVMTRLQNPLMLVDKLGNILLKNKSAEVIAQQLGIQQLSNISDFSPALALRFQKWLKQPQQSQKSFVLEKIHMEVQPQFTALNADKSDETIVVLEDIGKLNQLAQQQKLASLGRLTASIAHEIRNPLAAISHASELLAESESIDATDKRLTGIIQQHSKRLNEIIDSVLNMSRRKQALPEHIILSQWLPAFIQKMIHFSDDQIQLNIRDEPEILFDQQHLQQILTNLLNNAIYYANKEKQHNKMAESCPVLLNCYCHEAVIIEVINAGQPISSEDQRNLFEPFFTTKKNSGTGLGLYMAKELAQTNQATLEYQYLHDRRQTCFRLNIPLIL